MICSGALCQREEGEEKHLPWCSHHSPAHLQGAAEVPHSVCIAHISRADVECFGALSPLQGSLWLGCLC